MTDINYIIKTSLFGLVRSADLTLFLNKFRNIEHYSVSVCSAMARIQVGQIFQSFSEFASEKELYEETVKANFVVSKSKVDKNNAALKYIEVLYDCKFRGRHDKSGNSRVTKTYKQQCPSYISVRQKSRNNVRVLEIANMVEEHNHPLNEELFRHMPKQRIKLIKENEKDLEKYFSTKSNYAAIQNKINIESEGQIVTRRDLYNAKVKFDQMKYGHENELVQLVQQMANIPETVTRVVADDNGSVDFIYFQDQRMKSNFKHSPEIIFFDGTYNTNDRRMPLIVILTQDGSGCSQVVAFIIVKSENGLTLKNLFDVFKEENPCFDKIKVILSDKSFACSLAFRQAFPQASHQLCIFHVIQIFEREVTTKKRNIDIEQKNRIHGILRAMVYADSEARYMYLYTKFKQMNCPEMHQYFDDNWHNIRQRWVGCYVKHFLHFGNRTNNRLESFNHQIKSIVSKYSPLTRFFDDLMICTNAFHIERDHEAADDLLRQPLVTEDGPCSMKQWSKILTNHAFRKIQYQARIQNTVIFSDFSSDGAECMEDGSLIETRSNSCSCSFFSAGLLPCKHMFAFWIRNKECTFQPDICDGRWFNQNNKFLSEYTYATNDNVASTSQVVVQTVSGNDNQRKLNRVEKYKKAEQELKRICEIMSEKRQPQFQKYLDGLKQFRQLLEEGELPGRKNLTT